MAASRILLLGGTGEARDLASLLAECGMEVVTSLAGATRQPLLPAVGEVRRGGFGGEDGLAGYIRDARIAAIVDATHPFAAQMSRQACAVAARLKIPCLRLERPAWSAEPGDTWIAAASAEAAAALLPPGARVFLTIGRKNLAVFFARVDIGGIARMIEPPTIAMPPGWSLILARPPFAIAEEDRTLDTHNISHLVSKNAGGEAGRAKLVAAHERKIPVVMLARPQKPVTPSFWPAEALVPALRRMLSP
jgi:precorrin-6A/cobalt-precorrin-6A reductase